MMGCEIISQHNGHFDNEDEHDKMIIIMEYSNV